MKTLTRLFTYSSVLLILIAFVNCDEYQNPHEAKCTATVTAWNLAPDGEPVFFIRNGEFLNSDVTTAFNETKVITEEWLNAMGHDYCYSEKTTGFFLYVYDKSKKLLATFHVIFNIPNVIVVWDGTAFSRRN